MVVPERGVETMAMTPEVLAKLEKAQCSYIYCNICGRVPEEREETNWAPLRWWDCDDGWKIGTLCRWCAEDALPVVPQPDDYAYPTTNGLCDDDNVGTDLDPLDALPD